MMIDLDAIKVRRAAATPGPWWHEYYLGAWRVRPNYAHPAYTNTTREICDTSDGDLSEEDAVFIAHAPADIDALLAHVATLAHQATTQAQRAERAEAEAARLRALLAEVEALDEGATP
jgi:hypothetical protein